MISKYNEIDVIMTSPPAIINSIFSFSLALVLQYFSSPPGPL